MTAAKVLPVIVPRAPPTKHCPTPDSASFPPLSHPLIHRGRMRIHWPELRESAGPSGREPWSTLLPLAVAHNRQIGATKLASPGHSIRDNYREMPCYKFRDTRYFVADIKSPADTRA